MERKAKLALAGTLAVVALPTPGSALAADARIRAVHVTQSVQAMTANSVPLVADRSTAIRALIDEVDGNVTGVTGRAHVTVDGVRVTPPGGIPPITEPAATFNPVPNPSLDVETDTLNFELPAPTGIAPRDDPFASGDVDVRVTIAAPGDADASNNSATASNLRVESKLNPIVFFRRMRYTPFSATTQASNAFIAGGRGDAYLRAAFPVDDSDGGLYRRLDDDATYGLVQECPLVTLLFCSADPSRIDALAIGGPPEGDLRLLANEIERMVLAAGSGIPGEIVNLYEWVPDGALNPAHAGLGSMGVGRVAYGIDRPNRGQSTFAHEVGHNLGLVPNTDDGHNASDFTLSTSVGWDVGARLVGNPAGNNASGRLKPSTFVDRWNPTQNGNTASAWIRRTNYRRLFDALPPTTSRLFGNREDAGGRRIVRRPRCIRNLPVIFGLVDRYDRDTLRARRITQLQTFRAPWCNVLPLVREVRRLRASGARPGSGAMTAVVTVRRGRRTRTLTLPVDARVQANTHDVEGGAGRAGEAIGLGPFALQVPVAGDVVALRIRDDAGRTVLNRRARRAEPDVSIAGLRSGDVLRGARTLRWTTRTPAPRAVRHVAAYSADRGRTWIPLAIQLRGRSLRLDPRGLPRSGAGRIRVLVTDGLNTDVSTVSGLRVGGRGR